ncbi:MAG TPA: NAD-dependent epimerase/dehydratase family protein [Bryobacteraceae bacterium]|nr:NAD-dependent epimerase/dehydratase family protein [Bryobacteraceae bacterium]
MQINNETELEERLSRPTEKDAAAMAELDGDLLILGVGGKMGPSLAKLARRAAPNKRIIAVARFSDPNTAAELHASNIETIACDLLEPGALGKLPDAPNVIFMAARKFGTTGSAHLTWAMNTYLPGLVAERYRDSKIVAFSSGNVYGLVPAASDGCTESHPVTPEGEYAQSVLGRERMFEYGSDRWHTKIALLRLNYAVDLRYGVLVDIATAVFERRPVDVRMGWVNVIWQGDANSMCLRSFAYCDSPPRILNITGPEKLSVREVANQLGRRFGKAPIFSGTEGPTALLNNGTEAHRLFGPPEVSAAELLDWVAHWIEQGGRLLNKPTHFEARDGKF